MTDLLIRPLPALGSRRRRLALTWACQLEIWATAGSAWQRPVAGLTMAAAAAAGKLARFGATVAGQMGIALARLARSQLTVPQQEALQRADAAANRRLQRVFGDNPVRRLSPAVAAIACVSIVAAATVGPAGHAPEIRLAAAPAAARAVTARRTRPARPLSPPSRRKAKRSKSSAPAAPPTPGVPSVQNASKPATRGALPVGKGMWIYVPEETEHGDVNAIVAKANSIGLTHLYVRTGSSPVGFYAQDFLNRLLPVAHAHGLRVFAWDYPYFRDNALDVARAVQAVTYTTPTGQRVDGLSADIEYSDGTNLRPETVADYGARLRQAVGSGYPLIATVERPNPGLTYPFAEAVASFDAVAPMIYWLETNPLLDLDWAFAALRGFGKPILPIGQAYDGAADGGPPGVPNRATIQAFMAHAKALGAAGVSFWSWQGANDEAFAAIRDAPEFIVTAHPTS